MATVDFDFTANDPEELGITNIKQPTKDGGAAGLVNAGGSLSTYSKNLRSSNFKSGNTGWFLGSNGSLEFNGLIEPVTNFSKIFTARGVSFYVSDGTTPQANLSGNVGDICFGGASGNTYRCTGTTNWTAL